MGDPFLELDRLVREIDKAIDLLKKVKTPQVRNAEHKAFFRSIALSWFQGRRSTVVLGVPPEVVEGLDAPYRILLNATERNSSKQTYLDAARLTKQALIEVRARTLVPTPSVRTADSTPNFAPLASDLVMQSILERRWDECRRCVEAGAPLAATVMMGGLLEALLVGRANKLSDKSKLFTAAATPIDAKSKKPLDLRQWMLAPYIDVGHEFGWISNSAKNVAVILRDYRNYIHPEKERAHGIALSPDDAAMFWEVTKNLSRELLAMKGVT